MTSLEDKFILHSFMELETADINIRTDSIKKGG
jgi:hypothetical protein